MATYSMDLRRRVMRAVDEGQQTDEEIAARYEVSSRWIRKLKRQRRETGSIAPRPKGTGQRAKVCEETLARAVENQPDATLEELREACAPEASLTSVWRALNRLKLTLKKSR